MFIRKFWLEKISNAWKQRPIVWLSGVRRVGKTTLAKMVPDAVYLNCDLPSTTQRLQDPEFFYQQLPDNTTLIFDEIHRLADPSLVLKIAADEYPHLKILATGSSTLAATNKFRDSLTGRKTSIYLPPVLWTESQAVFKQKELDHRLIYGGLPEMLLSEHRNLEFYTEWLDSFYARDVQELFSIRQRSGFLKLLRLLFRQSGGMLQYSNLAGLSDLSRPTVNSYLEAMQIANAVFLVPPFHGGSRREIIRQPKAYGFDTGFITFLNGWDTLRGNERGLLWEHLVLDTLRTDVSGHQLLFWRNKSGQEVDFVIKTSNSTVIAIECKISPEHFDGKNIAAFRDIYPQGKNYIICPGIQEPYNIKSQGLTVHVAGTDNISMIG